MVDVQATTGEKLQAACVGWDVRYAQLGAGRFQSRYVSVHTAGLQMCVEDWSLGMLKRGRAPRGSVTFLVPVGRRLPHPGASRGRRRRRRPASTATSSTTGRRARPGW